MENTEITKEQARILYDAMWDLEKTGKTEIKCPKCGNDLAVETFGTSATVYCKTDGCLRASRWGI